MSRKKTRKKSKASAGRPESKIEKAPPSMPEPVASVENPPIKNLKTEDKNAEKAISTDKDSKKPLPDEPKSNNWRRVQRLLFILGFTLILVSADAYINLERKVYDFFIDFNSVPGKDKQVVIVQIDDDDYIKLFGATSPLAPSKVTEIIDAISLGKPKVLGIDLFTGDQIHKEYVPKRSPFPIVWAEEPIINGGRITGFKKPLGNQALPENNCSALPGLPIDGDRVHRLYQRVVEINEKYHQTFAWLIHKLAEQPDGTCLQSEAKEENTREYYIRFAGQKQQSERLVVSASQILDDAKTGNLEELEKFLKDKIVLLGGMYPDSRDKGLVPFTELYGVEILATVVETELSGNPQMPISNWVKIILNLLMILIFTINFFHYGFGKKSVVIAISAIFVLAITISLVQYNSFLGVPLLISIFLYGLFIALFDLLMDKYKENFSFLFSEINRFFTRLVDKKKAE